MEERVLNLKDQIGKKRRFRKYWKNIFTALAVVVVFCTTYALILPAISQERKVYCGQERHVHGEGCYVNELICGLSDEAPAENPDVEYHQHSEEECYTTTTNLICPLESSKGHTHTEECKKLLSESPRYFKEEYEVDVVNNEVLISENVLNIIFKKR